MKDLLILGTGSHAMEMAFIVDRINRVEPSWNLLGHITPNEEITRTELLGRPVLGTPAHLEQFPDAALVPENNFPGKQELPRNRLVNLIEPSAWIHPSAELGKGCVIYPDCYIGAMAKLGDCVFALSGATINHHDKIGDRVVFASRATLAGKVTVEEDCYMGQSCSVREFLKIGRNSMIGMGAVVVRDVEANSVMAGNPAKRIKSREWYSGGGH